MTEKLKGETVALAPPFAEFEAQLVAGLARLVSAPTEEIDRAIIESQRTLLRLLGMDRSTIWLGDPAEPSTLLLTHLCSLVDIPPTPARAVANAMFPWVTAKSLAGEEVRISDVRQLPPEAAVDQKTFTQFGTRSVVAIPFARRATEPAGVISFVATTPRESWPEPLLVQCRMLVQVIHSVVARKRADQAALSERARLRAILDSTGFDLIWLVDSERFGLQTWNRAFEENRRRGGQPPPTEGMTPEVVCAAPEEAAFWRQQYQRVLDHGPFSLEHRIGSDLNLLLALNPVTHEGRCVGVSVFGRDVTVQTRQQAELEKVQRQLQHAQKTEEIGRLAAGVAHDFNNLLTVILATCSFLGEELAGTQAADDLQDVLDAGNRAADLTRQLLAFSRQQHRHPREVDLTRTLKDAHKMLRRVLREDVELSIQVAPDQVWVFADPTELDQVIINLVVNARDAMPRGGKLHLSLRERELDAAEAMVLGELQPGRYAELRVRDTGEGIAPEHLSHVFEPFFTTKEQGKGTGLGLATVLNIVRETGGAIRLESKVGEGTEAVVLLPRLAGAVAGTRPLAPGMRLVGGETILVAEDDEQVGGVLARMLRSGGYQVQLARRGDEALALARAHEGRLDLLFTDLIMPGMSGMELARTLLEAHPEVKVLFASGFSDVAAAELAAVSTVPLLAKPYSRDAVLAAVRAALDAPAKATSR